jgi:organic radical activating enzyme
VLTYADELKVVLPGGRTSTHSDGWSYAEMKELAERIDPIDLFVQPQDPIDTSKVQVSFLHTDYGEEGSYKANVNLCIGFIMVYPAWRLSLQTHKLVVIP